MKTTLKRSKRLKLPPTPRAGGAEPGLTAAQVEKELRAQGFKPTGIETKRLLQASGHWGMPDE
jgi:hypothetical protein